MKKLVAAAAVLLMQVSGLFAGDIDALQSMRASSLMWRASRADTPAPAVLSEEKMSSSFYQVDRCWSRTEDKEADGAGLPRRFCVKRIGIEVPAYGPDIFDRRASMLYEDAAGLKRIFITGFARKGEDRTVIGSIYGEGGGVFAAIYFDTSLDGKVRPALPEIRGFMLRDGGAAKEILYSPEAR